MHNLSHGFAKNGPPGLTVMYIEFAPLAGAWLLLMKKPDVKFV
jgi:hypothetical protein